MPDLPSTTTLGSFLREARKKRGLTQKELAEKAFGDSALFQQVSNYERGAYIPKAERMARLIVALDLGSDIGWRAWGEEHLSDVEDDSSLKEYFDYAFKETEALIRRFEEEDLHRVAREKVAADLVKEGGAAVEAAARDAAKGRRRAK